MLNNFVIETLLRPLPLSRVNRTHDCLVARTCGLPVNWHEIAEHLIDDVDKEEEEETEEEEAK